VDQPVDWITVEYSDGTKKSVTSNSAGPATDMAGKVKAALALAPSKGNAHPKLMMEDTYDYFSDDGTGGQGLLARVYDDGTVEYGNYHWGKEIRTGRVSKGTIVQLGAILNSTEVRELSRSYPAFDQWGYTAMTYKIRFFSGGVEQQVTAINVLPVHRGHREEYPTALLRLVCAVADIRDAVEPRKYEQKRGDCDEFPRLAKPNIQPTQK
jgi:hypothetical protein